MEYFGHTATSQLVDSMDFGELCGKKIRDLDHVSLNSPV
jgi:hypothetical protein